MSLWSQAGPGAQESERFGEEERVTAIDLVVDPWEGGASAKKSVKDLTPEDFESDRRRRAAACRRDRAAQLRKPVRIVAGRDLCRRSPIQRIHGPLGFGPLAAAELKTLFAWDKWIWSLQLKSPSFCCAAIATRGMLRSSLARLSESERGRDELTALRSAFLTALHSETGDYAPEEFRLAFRAEEERLIRGRLDMLLTFLAEDSGAGSRRVLFLVSDGFDLVPDDFYSMWSKLEAERSEASASPKASSLRAAHRPRRRRLGDGESSECVRLDHSSARGSRAPQSPRTRSPDR